MATRTHPTKRHGAIPELDDHITRKKGSQGGGVRIWNVGDTAETNLTKARLKAAVQLGLQDKYPDAQALAKAIDYTPGSGHKRKPHAGQGKHPRKTTTKKATSMPKPTAHPTAEHPAHKPAKRAYNRKPQTAATQDPYNAASRIFVRLAGGEEVSFPPNASDVTISNTIRGIKNAHGGRHKT